MFFLAFRQLFSRPQQTILTFIGILLGAAAYIIFSGIMLGFQEYITDKLINNDSQIRISPRDDLINEAEFRDVFFKGSEVKWLTPPSGRYNYNQLTNLQGWFEKLSQDKNVVAYAPQINRNVLFNLGKFTLPGRLLGIDPVRQLQVTTLQENIVQGSLQSLTKGVSLVIVGDGLLQKLGARVDGNINVINSYGRSQPVKIVGIFHTGARQLDESLVFASISSVQQLTQSTGEITDIVIKLKNVEMARELASEWALHTRDKVESWDMANESMLSVFQTQNIMRNAITFTIILVVAFGIYNILNMVVNQKKRDIAILRSIGYSQTDVLVLFFIQSVLLGFFGGLCGIIVGYIACRYFETIEVFSVKNSRGMMALNHLIVSYNYMIYVRGFALVMISSMIAGLIPARLAGKLSPIEIIRGTS